MNLRKNIAVSETGFLFNPSTGDSFAANPLAAEIIDSLRQGLEPVEIKKRLLEKYDVDPLRLDRDWDDFFKQLRNANLLAD